MVKKDMIRFRGFYEKGKGIASMNAHIEKIQLKKVDFNKWYCYLVLKPISNVGNRLLFMRMSKRVQLLFKRGFVLTIDVDTFTVENSIIELEGHLNKKFTTWKHVLYDIVRVPKNEFEGDDGDLDEYIEEEEDE